MPEIPAWAHGRNFPPAIAIPAIRNPDTDPETRLFLCASLIPLGIVRWTFDRLGEMRSDPALRHRADQLMAMCRSLWEYDLDGTVLEADPSPDERTPNYWLVPAASEKTLLVFSGTDARLWVSIYLLQRMLEPFRVNVVYLFDPVSAYYLGGIGGRHGGYRDTLDLLKSVTAALGTRRLFCLGNSSGGYAALRYALDLGAVAVLTLSPVIHQLRNPRRIEELNRKLSADFSPDSLDLRQVYSAHRDAGGAMPRSILLCGGENRSDMRSAAEVADLPGTEVRVLPGVRSHNIIGSLIANQQIRPLLAEFLGS